MRRYAKEALNFIPGHEGVQGNELADKASRKAAERETQTSRVIALALASKRTAR